MVATVKGEKAANYTTVGERVAAATPDAGSDQGPEVSLKPRLREVNQTAVIYTCPWRTSAPGQGTANFSFVLSCNCLVFFCLVEAEAE